MTQEKREDGNICLTCNEATSEERDIYGACYCRLCKIEERLERLENKEQVITGDYRVSRDATRVVEAWLENKD